MSMVFLKISALFVIAAIIATLGVFFEFGLILLGFLCLQVVAKTAGIVLILAVCSVLTLLCSMVAELL